MWKQQNAIMHIHIKSFMSTSYIRMENKCDISDFDNGISFGTWTFANLQLYSFTETVLTVQIQTPVGWQEWKLDTVFKIIAFFDTIIFTMVMKSCCLNFHSLSISSNQSGQSSPTFLINKRFLYTELQLTGSFFLFFFFLLCKLWRLLYVKISAQKIAKYSNHWVTEVNINWRSWTVSAWFYALYFILWLSLMSWMSMCTVLPNKVAGECICNITTIFAFKTSCSKLNLLLKLPPLFQDDLGWSGM